MSRAGEVAGDEPTGGPERGGPAVEPGPGGRRLAGRATPWASSAPMTPVSTSPVPAVARRASPAATTSTSPSGSATTVVGPLSSTTAPVARRQRSRARRAGRAPGGAPGQALVLAVVGREHGRRRPVAQHVGGVRAEHASARRRRPRTGRSATASARGRDRGVVAGCPRPGPTTRRWSGRRGERGRRAQPWAGSVDADRLGRAPAVVVDARGRRRRTMPAPARCAARGAEVGGAGHPGRPGHDQHARPATCGPAAAGAGARRRRRRARRGRTRRPPRRGRCRRRRPRRPATGPARAAARASARRT